MGRRIWSPAKIDRLFEMRDVEDMTWAQIAEEFHYTGANCCTRYKYYKTKRHIEAIRRGDVAPDSQPVVSRRSRWTQPRKPVPAVVVKPVKPVKPQKLKQAPASEPVIHRPRYFHEADADIVARIERQGLTAGFLGDPPPGRSALDQRTGHRIG